MIIISDIEHDNLLNSAKYFDLPCLKKLYRNYNNLEKLATMGNRAAMAIFLDLKNALHQKYVTANQREAIIIHLIDGHCLEDAAVMRTMTSQAVHDCVTRGLTRIKKILMSGEVYYEPGQRCRLFSKGK